jgi:hypothetical protein
MTRENKKLVYYVYVYTQYSCMFNIYSKLLKIYIVC